MITRHTIIKLLVVSSVWMLAARCIDDRSSPANADVLPDTTMVIDDFSEPMSLEDQVGWTEVQLNVLHQLVAEFDGAHGALPDSLINLVPEFLEAGEGSRMYLVDAWGSAIKYTKAPTGFVLRSSGPDRRFDTIDDLLLAGNAIP